jgi:hypothetical protein
MQKVDSEIRLADRIWVAVALLHQKFPLREDFSKEDIRQEMRELGLMAGLNPGSVAAHLKEHMVANVPPSTGKYRMLFESRPGRLRLYVPGDEIDPRRQLHRPSKQIPKRDELPTEYHPLLDWYTRWCDRQQERSPAKYEDDPLIRLIGSGQHIWADEHADEYVNRLREEQA